MSIARHHTEWLSLVPVSGPFLSLPVLMEAFNAGLEPHDPEHSRLLRQAYADWLQWIEQRTADPAPHHEWLKFVLNRTLDLDERVLLEGQAISQTFNVEIPEHRELLRPSVVVCDPSTKKPRMLVQTYPRSQELTSYVANSSWKASPDTRMTELLHGTGVSLGLVTNGEHWMLVNAPKGETTGYASWYASLWLEEQITLRAFRSLLSVGRFFNVPDDETLETLLAKSASNQQEVTDQLGYQVRRAVEVLIHSLDRADQDFGRELLADVTPEQLYESALTVMMRLVFLFCAEERELIPSKPFPVYEQNYSVSAISKQLRELADQHGEELLERRYDAWPRLLAAFRAVYGGLQHDAVNLPAYGGSLFDPDRFPFFEGRKTDAPWTDAEANPLPVNNRTVLHLLEALQLLQIKMPGGGQAEARRLSFRALDIEQIGHVYEGLLDHTAKRATEPYLGLVGTRDKEPEIPLAEIEKLVAKGEGDLLKFLKEETGKSDSALKKLLKLELETHEVARLRTVCQGDDSLWKRVQPLAGVVRPDSFGYPVVIPEGSVFVTSGTDRRSSGTHYTPRSLTEPIVQYTLEPLVYHGPAEGLPKSEWKLKSAKELLALKICDMACGSGAFLVQACRYLAERVLEAWEAARQANPDCPGITPEGLPSAGNANEELIPDDPAERKLYAMRLVAQRCLYGVDKNPLAVEMAKLSLWLLTMAKDKPFEFLDHNIRSGDSLVGLHNIDQLRHFSLKPDANDAVLFKGPLDDAVDEAINLRLKLEDLPANSVEDVQRQEKLLVEANEKIARLRCAADLLVAAEFWGENAKDKLERVKHASIKSVELFEKGPTEEFQQLAVKERKGQVMFHWPLEFPEVIAKRGGFDAFVGNPPFLGGARISGTFGDNYLALLLSDFGSSNGNADVCSFFIRRAAAHLTQGGCCGFVATNSIAKGETRTSGLQYLLDEGYSLVRAVRSQPWPGTANVFISTVHVFRGSWGGDCMLDGHSTSGISSFLDAQDGPFQPFRLAENLRLVFRGPSLNGEGFILTPEERRHLIELDPRSEGVIKPFLTGQDVNQHPRQVSDRYAIDMEDMSEDEASQFTACWNHLYGTVRLQRLGNKIPQREKYWWRYTGRQEKLYEAISGFPRVFVCGEVSKYWGVSWVSPQQVFAGKVVVFALQGHGNFALLNSCFHTEWAEKTASRLKGDPSYSLADTFETFPRPHCVDCVESQGAQYHSTISKLMTDRSIGLTTTYNCFHDSEKRTADIQKLRDLHVEMDQAVAAAYGWTDLDLGHGFHETKQGVRFTISEPARREVLQRLLKLNHERYAEEVKQGLHDKKGAAKKAAPKKKAASKPAKQEASLFDGEDDE